MSENRFYVCKHCGNLVGMIRNSGVPIICCGEPMTELVPGSVDASLEKHVPVVTVEGNGVAVTVGSVPHPMTEEHYIEWIYLQTERGGQRKTLTPSDAPSAAFTLNGDRPVAAFAYCNLHGLWKTDIK
ncbi:MAG: desulfoferrodoxin family protein [Oscillospiraceae bacterium]|nr:desulfoferrodoxin family protein [Oscillospiraceae bacterium]